MEIVTIQTRLLLDMTCPLKRFVSAMRLVMKCSLYNAEQFLVEKQLGWRSNEHVRSDSRSKQETSRMLFSLLDKRYRSAIEVSLNINYSKL